jgi:hypothetical protein
VAAVSIHQKGERGAESLRLIRICGKGHLRAASLFELSRQCMLVYNHAERERGVPFYERNMGQFITSG